MTIGKRLRNLRELKSKETGTTIYVKDVAEAIDVSPSAMYMYERDERIPPADRLVALAEYYKVSVDYLLCRDVDRRSHVYEPQQVRDMRLRQELKHSGATDEDIRFIMDLLHRRRILNEP